MNVYESGRVFESENSRKKSASERFLAVKLGVADVPDRWTLQKIRVTGRVHPRKLCLQLVVNSTVFQNESEFE